MDSPLKGKVLLASPGLMDPNFAQSVVLIVQHDQKGAMGLVINRPTETTVRQAWTQVSSVPYPNDDPLYHGGPVEGPLMVLHPDEARGQLEVIAGLFLTSDADAVKSLVDDGLDTMKFFVGCAGWSPLQLESELTEGAWRVADITPAQVLDTPRKIWEILQREVRSVAGLRPAVDPRFIPPDPSVN